jgi:hypothetical protein
MCLSPGFFTHLFRQYAFPSAAEHEPDQVIKPPEVLEGKAVLDRPRIRFLPLEFG